MNKIKAVVYRTYERGKRVKCDRVRTIPLKVCLIIYVLNYYLVYTYIYIKHIYNKHILILCMYTHILKRLQVETMLNLITDIVLLIKHLYNRTLISSEMRKG